MRRFECFPLLSRWDLTIVLQSFAVFLVHLVLSNEFVEFDFTRKNSYDEKKVHYNFLLSLKVGENGRNR